MCSQRFAGPERPAGGHRAYFFSSDRAGYPSRVVDRVCRCYSRKLSGAVLRRAHPIRPVRRKRVRFSAAPSLHRQSALPSTKTIYNNPSLNKTPLPPPPPPLLILLKGGGRECQGKTASIPAAGTRTRTTRLRRSSRATPAVPFAGCSAITYPCPGGGIYHDAVCH